MPVPLWFADGGGPGPRALGHDAPAVISPPPASKAEPPQAPKPELPRARHGATPPWLAAPFRPFYLLGAGYGVLLMALAGLGFAGVAPGAFPMAWHGHEMIFGFAMAIIAGTVLTALPTWAGTPETRGAPLAGLVALWLGARVANALAGPASLPWPLLAACGAALPLAMVLHLAPQVMRLPQRRWRMVPVVFAALAGANVAWHAAHAGGDVAGTARALRGALWVVLVLYTLAGGLFTPVFTADVLQERRLRALPPAALPLEAAALLSTIAAAAADVVAGAASRRPNATAGVLALVAAALQAWRVARWRGWQARGEPLVLAMHLGFAWAVTALALAGAAHLGWVRAPASWVHAFTAGALGSMMLGLMTRVALRHTGREVAAPRWLPAALLAVSAATVLRLAAPWLGTPAWSVAALLWAAAMGAWWVQYAPVLLRPSVMPVAERASP